MKRREFITLLGGAAATWPLAARAQQASKLPTIGFLGATTPSAGGQLLAAFVQRLRELGWVEGRNVAIESRWAEGRGERFAEIAAEFVRLKVDIRARKRQHAPQQTTSLLNHLVGAGEQRDGRVEAQRLGSLEIDDQLEFGGLLDRQIARLFASEDAIDVGRCPPVWINRIRPIGHETSGCNEKADWVDRG
jgi:hypothetical protein